MERGGLTLENPYASVTIPRAQLENSFIKRYLGDEPPSPTVIVNPGAVPTYPASELLNGASKPLGLASWDGFKVAPQESLAQLYNPYASLERMNGMSPDGLYTIELNKHHKGPEAGSDGGCCCCKFCPCCRKCCCVVS
ncbi:cysteine-rich tail protein 1 [Pelodiscus sinensis]|uniref:cysteine-rich tail protein 1 n=1 Tax=Pelodiscus sinensis TaxID=13735 RepID=UPI003F6D3563